jgi:predicted RecA/RadA family phage recombinase
MVRLCAISSNPRGFAADRAGGREGGGVVHVGALIGVATSDAAQGAEVETHVGVFELPKATGALAQGALAFWDAQRSSPRAAREAKTTPRGFPLLGTVTAAAGADAALVRVRLNGVSA